MSTSRSKRIPLLPGLLPFATKTNIHAERRLSKASGNMERSKGRNYLVPKA
jgi:hypothetical protein